MCQAFGPSPSVPPPAAAYYAAAGPRTPYGPKDRGPLVLRAGPGAKGDGGPTSGGRTPGPRTPSVLGRALCQTGYSVVCSRGVGTRGEVGGRRVLVEP